MWNFAQAEKYDERVVNRPPTIGERLYRLREHRGWTLREAAKRASISFSRLGEWERGQDAHSGKELRPSYQALCRLARTYDVPRDELLRLAGYEPELSDEEQGLLNAFRELPEESRSRLFELLTQLKAGQI